METFETILSIMVLLLAVALAYALFKINNPSRQKRKGDILGKRPPFIDLGLDVATGFMETHCERNIEYISRHWISEQDVKCPRCALTKTDTLLVEQGDYSGVKWTWVHNGVERHKNECIFCDECQNWMLASPDTEHNDHTNSEEDPPEYFYFVRKSEIEVVRDKFGEDVVDVDDRGISISADGDPDATFDRPAVPKNSIDNQPIPTEPSPPVKRGAAS